jgi:hypothetical protein
MLTGAQPAGSAVKQRDSAQDRMDAGVKHGLYGAADGRRINADVNGAYNEMVDHPILRKVLPDSFGGIASTAVCRVRLPVRTKRVA